MSKLIDLSGKKFGRLTAVEPKPNATWLCRCDCGNEIVAFGRHIRFGRTKSCGCLRSEVTGARAKVGHFGFKHGQSGGLRKRSPTYSGWSCMIQRCENPRHKHYRHYGGRGITVCERWHEFELFFEDMGERPAGRTLDRINVNGNYEPNNCRWATAREQRLNTRPRSTKRDAH